MPNDKKLRTFVFELDSSDNLTKWCIEYNCAFEQVDTQHVVVAIAIDTTYRTTITIEDCGITWKTLLYAWKWCADDAVVQVLEYERLDASLRDGSSVIPVTKLSTGKEQ